MFNKGNQLKKEGHPCVIDGEVRALLYAIPLCVRRFWNCTGASSVGLHTKQYKKNLLVQRSTICYSLDSYHFHSADLCKDNFQEALGGRGRGGGG